MNISLDHFFEERKKLEAIGLLKTYVLDDEHARTYYYVVVPPFSSRAFFQDPMLSILLKHHVGEIQYNRLKNCMMDQNKLPENVQSRTRSFNEVFTTVLPEMPDFDEAMDQVSSTEEQAKDYLIDFEYLAQALQKYNIPDQHILTPENKQYMNSLVRIYQLNQLEMEKALLWSIDESFHLSTSDLHEACLDFYVKKYGQTRPALNVKAESWQSGKKQGTGTKEDKLIEHFETITHREILEDYSSTGFASEQEVKMITNIMHQHGLPQPVMNVLIHYVLQKTDMKLTRNYVEKIATHWSRKKVKTAREAMKLAKSENRLYQSWGTGRKSRSESREVLPEWFKKQKQKEKDESSQTNTRRNQRDIEKEKQELARALKNISSKPLGK